MDNTINVGLSYQMALRRDLDIVANNIANMNTTAFKTQTPLFRQFSQGTAGAGRGQVGLTMVQDFGVARDLSEGELAVTGNPLDIGIHGPGFFTVEGPGGTPRYTRNGHFQLNDQGLLVTGTGYPVLGPSGRPIRIDAGAQEITFATDGTISTSTGIVGHLGVVTFDNEQDMQELGNGLLATQQAPVVTTEAEIHQGMLERSNVKAIIEMTKMIDVLRSYQSTARLMQSYQDLQRRAVQRLGRFTP